MATNTQPAPGTKPSLVGSGLAAGEDALPSPPTMRMLDAIGSDPGRGGTSSRKRPTSWHYAALSLALVAMVAAVVFGWSARRAHDMPALDTQTSASTPVVESSTTAEAAATDIGAQAPPPFLAPDANTVSSGPANIEASPARAAPAATAAATFAQAASSSAITGTAAAAASAASPRVAPSSFAGLSRPVTSQPRTSRAVAPRVEEISGRSTDPDVTLLTAILARISRDVASGQITQVNATIGPLVARCEAQSADDPIGALACKRQVCADFWGRVDGCPMSLAPKAP